MYIEDDWYKLFDGVNCISQNSTSLARVSVCLGLLALKLKTNKYECPTLEQNVEIQVNQNPHSKCNRVEYILEYYFFCFDWNV